MAGENEKQPLFDHLQKWQVRGLMHTNPGAVTNLYLRGLCSTLENLVCVDQLLKSVEENNLLTEELGQTQARLNNECEAFKTSFAFIIEGLFTEQIYSASCSATDLLKTIENLLTKKPNHASLKSAEDTLHEVFITTQNKVHKTLLCEDRFFSNVNRHYKEKAENFCTIYIDKLAKQPEAHQQIVENFAQIIRSLFSEHEKNKAVLEVIGKKLEKDPLASELHKVFSAEKEKVSSSASPVLDHHTRTADTASEAPPQTPSSPRFWHHNMPYNPVPDDIKPQIKIEPPVVPG
jgi:hypothetical protein